MTAPRFESKKIPGLVMWPNGHVVRVRVLDDAVITKEKYGESELSTAGTIARDRNGKPDVIASYGRVDLPGLKMRELGMRTEPEVYKSLDEKAFNLIAQYEEQKRRDLEHRVTQVISLAIVRAAKNRARGGYRDPT